MFRIEVVKCSSVDHKLRCLNEAIEAVRRAKHGNALHNGQKVTIRGAITDPCGCHLDALIWLASDMTYSYKTGEELFEAATLEGIERAYRSEMI